MAGDWMKIELELSDKPEVHYMANALNLDPDAVVGKLVRVWAWFDKHTEDGNAHGVTYSLLDRITSVTGFGEAMCFAGWLEQNDKVLHMPNFDRHNGESAKKRALTNKRVAKLRNAENVTKTLPEKRREEIYTPPAKTKKQPKRSWPTDFAVSDSVKTWAEEKGYGNLTEHFDNFRLQCASKGYQYSDWDSAFMRAVADDWAKLRVTAKRGLAL